MRSLGHVEAALNQDHCHARTRSGHRRSPDQPQAAATAPLGPGFTVTRMAAADTLEVWVTSLEEVADTTVLRLLRAGHVMAQAQVDGF